MDLGERALRVEVTERIPDHEGIGLAVAERNRLR